MPPFFVCNCVDLSAGHYGLSPLVAYLQLAARARFRGENSGGGGQSTACTRCLASADSKLRIDIMPGKWPCQETYD